MKRRRMTALLLGAGLLLSSCEGGISYAFEEAMEEEAGAQVICEEEDGGASFEETPAPEVEAAGQVSLPEETSPPEVELPPEEMAAQSESTPSEPETPAPLPESQTQAEPETAAPETAPQPQPEMETAAPEQAPQPPSEPETPAPLPEPQTQPESMPEDSLGEEKQTDAPAPAQPETDETVPEEPDAQESEASFSDEEMEEGEETSVITLPEGETDLSFEEIDLFEGETEIFIAEEESELVVEEETETLLEEETEKALGSDFGGYASSYFGRSSYYWDESWYISPDFRFTQVEKEIALVRKKNGSFVYEENKASARKVGQVPYGGAVCILKSVGDWYYIESGALRGFIPGNDLEMGEKAEKTVGLIGESTLTQGQLLIEKADNDAFTFTRTTSYPVLAKKVYALTKTPSWIYEYPDETTRHVGDAKSGTLLFILKDAGSGWLYVESGDVRGFVKREQLLTGDKAKKAITGAGEKATPLAQELIEPDENRSVYYTLLSVKSAGYGLASRICETAASYVGKLPYIYGGASLNTGADCSGFVQAVFGSFGINLPRTAQEMGASGQAVLSLEDAKPGDVIYYASGPHVGIYMGGGKVVQCSGNQSNTAANPGKGPMVCEASYMHITSIRRYLIEREKREGSGGYRTDDTPYSKEQLETIWAVVAQEDNGSYDGALAVISSAMNRTESPAWGNAGSNAYAQLTSPGQYCYSMDSNWIPRLGGNVPDYVKRAVDDCLNHGIRNHTYTSFRSSPGKATGSGAVKIGGNWYFGS